MVSKGTKKRKIKVVRRKKEKRWREKSKKTRAIRAKKIEERGTKWKEKVKCRVEETW